MGRHRQASQPGPIPYPAASATIITVCVPVRLLFLKFLFQNLLLFQEFVCNTIYPFTWQNCLSDSVLKWPFCILSPANMAHKYLCSTGLYLFLGPSVFSYCSLYVPPAVSSVCPFPSRESSLHLPPFTL